MEKNANNVRNFEHANKMVDPPVVVDKLEPNVASKVADEIFTKLAQIDGLFQRLSKILDDRAEIVRQTIPDLESIHSKLDDHEKRFTQMVKRMTDLEETISSVPRFQHLDLIYESINSSLHDQEKIFEDRYTDILCKANNFSQMAVSTTDERISETVNLLRELTDTSISKNEVISMLDSRFERFERMIDSKMDCIPPEVSEIKSQLEEKSADREEIARFIPEFPENPGDVVVPRNEPKTAPKTEIEKEDGNRCICSNQKVSKNLVEFLERGTILINVILLFACCLFVAGSSYWLMRFALDVYATFQNEPKRRTIY
jgi:predicted  nucleic acid-binding Zn-ribbon protein